MTVMMVMSVMMTMMIMIMIHEPMCPHPKNPLFKGSDWRTHCVREGLDVGLLQQPTVEILQPNAFDSILFTLKYYGALLCFAFKQCVLCAVLPSMVQEQGGIWPSLVLYINIHLSPEKLTRGGMVGLQGLVWWGIKSSIPHCGDHVYHTYHTVVTMYTTHTRVW